MGKISEKYVIEHFEQLHDAAVTWIDPRDVDFEHPEQLLEKNRKIYLEGVEDFDADEYTVDDMLVEIILATFNQVSVEQNVEALLYLIDQFWCVPAAARGGLVKRQLTQESASPCLEKIRTFFDRQTLYFPKHLLREFAIDLLSWGENGRAEWHFEEKLRSFMQNLYRDTRLARYTQEKAEADLVKLSAQASTKQSRDQPVVRSSL